MRSSIPPGQGKSYGSLPRGRWTVFTVPRLADESDIVQLFHQRTGVILPEDAVVLKNPQPGSSRTVAIVSISDDVLVELLSWTFSEDSIGGVPVEVRPAGKR